MIRLLEPWRTRLLWLSLGLNLFAIPVLLAPLVHHHPPHGPPSFDMVIDRVARDLPPDEARRFREAMAKERPWYELGRQQMDAAREQLSASLAREPFDAAAVNAALQAMQDKMHEGAARFDESLVLALGNLSPRGRTQLADGFRRHRF